VGEDACRSRMSEQSRRQGAHTGLRRDHMSVWEDLTFWSLRLWLQGVLPICWSKGPQPWVSTSCHGILVDIKPLLWHRAAL
jgi:hypothetical protein